ncbi:hypothetical protein [Paenibacillus bouchesdurhonensis]|uniref:hypothetical protein n=1 Tax=Paenibacillus bouchesdurhonensis TaxID=1870990 RepID=UPI000DA5FFB9|nr:hypothetical protein [Paenibacillus bouchesdurhonensis]
MDLKRITKQNLYDFVTKKVNAQRVDIKNQITKMIDSEADPVLNSWIRLGSVERDAERLAVSLEEAMKAFKILDCWKYQSVLADINSKLLSIERKAKEDIKQGIESFVQDPEHEAINLGHEEVNALTKRLQKVCRPHYKKLADLHKLRRELENVIASEANGQRGYKALVALGVDMSEFEAGTSNLPAVVKLSVDPCLLTGNCQ